MVGVKDHRGAESRGGTRRGGDIPGVAIPDPGVAEEFGVEAEVLGVPAEDDGALAEGIEGDGVLGARGRAADGAEGPLRAILGECGTRGERKNDAAECEDSRVLQVHISPREESPLWRVAPPCRREPTREPASASCGGWLHSADVRQRAGVVEQSLRGDGLWPAARPTPNLQGSATGELTPVHEFSESIGWRSGRQWDFSDYYQGKHWLLA